MQVDETETALSKNMNHPCGDSNLLRKPKLEYKPNLVERRSRSRSTDPDRQAEEKNKDKEKKKMRKNKEENVKSNQEQQQQQSISATAEYNGDGNRFQILSKESSEDSQNASAILSQIASKNLQGRNERPGTAQNATVSKNSVQINSSGSSSDSVRKEKVPPIVVFRQEVNDSIKIVKDVLKITDFRIKRYSSNRHAILLGKKEDYARTKEILKSVAAEHYTYCPKGEKVHTLLLKGLDPESNPDEILAELKALNLEDLNFSCVKRFETKVSKERKIKLPIFIVQLSSESQINKVKDVKYVNYQVVRWEKIERKDILQCKRCQRFGHTASNCAMKYRCVKCANEHEPGKCLIQAGSVENKDQLFCTLCKNYGHPASYRGWS